MVVLVDGEVAHRALALLPHDATIQTLLSSRVLCNWDGEHFGQIIRLRWLVSASVALLSALLVPMFGAVVLVQEACTCDFITM